VDPRWRGQRARQRAHHSLASGRSGAPKLAGGGAKGERSTGSSARASPKLGRRCSDRAMVVQNREAAALSERAVQAWREGERRGERCGETQ
jgi:hypothetical protein